MAYSIVLAEDQSLIRNSLKSLFDSGNDLRVIGTAENGYQALDVCMKLRPDIALLDIRMPQLDGLETSKELRKRDYSGKIVLLTTFQEDQTFFQALNLGVEGIFLKDIDPDVFTLSLLAIAKGVLVYHPVVLTHLREIPLQPTSCEDVFGLTEKDYQYIRAIAEGLSNKLIADRFSCSEGTVKNRVSSIMAKMGLEDRTQIAVYAIRHRLIQDLD